MIASAPDGRLEPEDDETTRKGEIRHQFGRWKWGGTSGCSLAMATAPCAFACAAYITASLTIWDYASFTTSLAARTVAHRADARRLIGRQPQCAARAIKVLVGKGLSQVRPKSGMRVRLKSDWNLLDRSVLGSHGSGNAQGALCRRPDGVPQHRPKPAMIDQFEFVRSGSRADERWRLR
jgi:hypothetical protein